MLHVDIPSAADLTALASGRADICVSIYLRTTPVTRETAGDRIDLKNLAKDAVNRLEENGANHRRVAAVLEQLDDLVVTMSSGAFRREALPSSQLPTTSKHFAFRMHLSLLS